MLNTLVIWIGHRSFTFCSNVPVKPQRITLRNRQWCWMHNCHIVHLWLSRPVKWDRIQSVSDETVQPSSGKMIMPCMLQLSDHWAGAGVKQWSYLFSEEQYRWTRMWLVGPVGFHCDSRNQTYWRFSGKTGVTASAETFSVSSNSTPIAS